MIDFSFPLMLNAELCDNRAAIKSAVNLLLLMEWLGFLFEDAFPWGSGDRSTTS